VVKGLLGASEFFLEVTVLSREEEWFLVREPLGCDLLASLLLLIKLGLSMAVSFLPLRGLFL